METKILSLFLLIGLSYAVNGEDNFYYPCQSQSNINCIRNYFVSTGRCVRTSHQDGVPILRTSHFAMYAPVANLTGTSDADVITFLGSEVTSFYVNRDTNNLVLSVNFEGISKYTPVLNFIVSQRGKEPVVVPDYLNVTYAAELTGVLPSRGLLGLKGSFVTSYITNAYPTYDVGSNVGDSSDPVVAAMFEQLVANIPTAVEELFLSTGPLFYYMFVQHYICDFGFHFSGDFV